MPVFVMEVLEVAAHPNADQLRVYAFGGLDGERIQVVANLSNVYAVGDRVAVARVGSELKDGTKIRPARLRGVDSFGMALGVHAGEVGSDISAEFELAESAPVAAQVVSWPSIELLHHVRAALRTAAELQQVSLPSVSYRCKVKLDGTNAGVQVHPNGSVVAQSRSSVIDSRADNMGFAAWVEQHRDYFAALASEEPIVVFGEWCGRGIQKRAAISGIDRKVFVVFALQYGLGTASAARVEVEPERLRALLPEHPDVFVLPWLPARFELDFADDAALEAEADRISELVSAVETCDPWVQETFGVNGLGEGIVLYPQFAEAGQCDRTRLAELMFKAKGEKHQAVRQKKAAQIAPEVARGIDEFVTLVVTEARLEQGLNEACSGDADMASMGTFLKWIAADVQKECQVELTAAGLGWEQVSRAISSRARSWFLARAQR
ncbi:MAG: RNA ligase family protein [Myxococcota bacterium]